MKQRTRVEDVDKPRVDEFCKCPHNDCCDCAGVVVALAGLLNHRSCGQCATGNCHSIVFET